MRIPVLVHVLLLLLFFCSNTAFSKELLVVRGDGDYSPYEIETEGQFKGFHIELLQAVAKNLPVTINFKSYPWKRALSLVEAGEADAVTYVAKNADREKYIIFTPGNEISYADIALIVDTKRKQEFYFDGASLDSLKYYEFGHLLGYSFSDLYDKASLNKHTFATVEQLFGMIKLRRIDIALINKDEFLHQKNKEGSGAAKISMLDNFIKLPNYIGFSRELGLGKLSRQFAKAMQEYKQTEDFLALQARYDISM